MSTLSTNSLSYRSLIRQSWPIILANAAVPLLGMIDTAVIGHFGSINELAALAMAALIFSFIYWGFGFLRMGTTGFVARAAGEQNSDQLMKILIQSSLLALCISFIILSLQAILFYISIQALSAPENIIEDIKAYFFLRIWGAPATLLQYVLTGVFIGLGESRKILILQILLNASNALLDIVFAGVMGLGIQGIALGTVIAEYTTLGVALWLILRKYPLLGFLRSQSLSSLQKGVGALLTQNGDIFIRTLFLLLSFAFFTRTSGSFGATTLAANHILLQFISFCAFFLDGFAYVLESLCGKAIGRRSLSYFNLVLKRMSVLSFVTAMLLSLAVFMFGHDLLSMFTNKELVIDMASSFVPIVAIYIALSVGAYLLDGVFIGAGYSSAMRNCSIASTLIFVSLWYSLFRFYGAYGLWMAFALFVLVRGLSLYLYLPKLRRKCIRADV